MRNFSSIVSSSLGNILEWYDFGLFTIFSSLFSKLFFPAEDRQTALIATVSIFAVGFLCRPLGALIFGYLGDRYGRAKTLRLSILMIFIPTLCIGFLPVYHHIGIAAPILLVIIRMWQGISIGGEYSGNLIYLAETAPNKFRATFTSLASMGSNIGILLATLVGMLTSRYFTDAMLNSWGWRIPYLVSGILCLFIYIFRMRIEETAVFSYLKQHHYTVKNPIKTLFQYNLPQLLRTLGLVCMGSTFYYFCFVYLPIFLATHFAFSVFNISTLMFVFISMMIILVPCAGFICDLVGRRKMLMFNASFILLVTIPGFYFLQLDQFIYLIIVLSLFTLASSLEQGATSVAVIENFPPPARYTGVSLGYNLGNGFLGGTIPIICAWLYTHTIPLSPAIYVSCCALITWIVIFFFVPETRGNNLMRLQKAFLGKMNNYAKTLARRSSPS